MNKVTFITGNQSKAHYLAKYLDVPIAHKKVNLDEIQSLDLKEIVKHKVLQAYEYVKSPVLVEDVSLEFNAFGRLPGTLIKHFVEEMPFESICRMLDGFDRTATARCMFGYYDGNEITYFEGALEGTIAEHPAGERGYGWDKIFIPKGYNVTRASLGEADDKATYLVIKPFEQLRVFLNKSNQNHQAK
jgi:inosine triphosphate pyrophosphatase